MLQAALLVLGMLAGSVPAPAGDDDDVAHIASEDLRAGGDASQRYFLIGPKKKSPPSQGYRLLIVMPGGDGGPDFLAFVKRIYDNSMSDQYLVAELVAPHWSDEQAKSLVWPTRTNPCAKARFTTEEFVAAVIADVKKKHPIDARSIFQLAWSSSGPAAYAIALQKDKLVAGSYIAMSVFYPAKLPPLSGAKGQVFFLDHSPDDETCKFKLAEQARDQLRKSGAKVELVTYEGGHGWQGDLYGRIRKGLEWLETTRR